MANLKIVESETLVSRMQFITTFFSFFFRYGGDCTACACGYLRSYEGRVGERSGRYPAVQLSLVCYSAFLLGSKVKFGMESKIFWLSRVVGGLSWAPALVKIGSSSSLGYSSWVFCTTHVNAVGPICTGVSDGLYENLMVRSGSCWKGGGGPFGNMGCVVFSLALV